MADQKLTDLTAIGTPALEDLLYLVDDPAGTPLSRKMTLAQLKLLLQTPTYVIAAADESVANNTPQDDDELFFTAVANAVYVFKLVLWFNAGASDTPDAQVGINLPSGTISNVQMNQQTGATSNTSSTWSNVSYLFTTGYQQAALGPVGRAVLSTATLANTPMTFEGVIRIGVTGGTVQVQFAQNTTTGGNPLVRRADSFLRYTRVS